VNCFWLLLLLLLLLTLTVLTLHPSMTPRTTQAVMMWVADTPDTTAPARPRDVAYYVGLPCCLATALLVWVWVRRGRYAPRPLIAPHLVYPWRGGGGASAGATLLPRTWTGG
jgi:hypothetical protein